MTKPRKGPMAKARCLHCGADRPVEMEKYILGDIIKPFAGGGTYGRCLRCQKEGLQIVEVPQTKLVKPKGWSKLPTE